MRKLIILCAGIFIASLLSLSATLMVGCQQQAEPVHTPSAEPHLSPNPPSKPTSALTTEELKVHFIDVGQGDSILVDLGDTEVLIDGGI